MNDAVIQSQVIGKATTATIIGTTGPLGMSLNVFAILGGALRGADAAGDAIIADMVESAIGVELE